MKERDGSRKDYFATDATRAKCDFKALSVTPCLPDPDAPSMEGAEFLLALHGAKIVRIGTPGGASFAGGGLLIDYQPSSSTETRRIVLAFNELGMWIEYEGSFDR